MRGLQFNSFTTLESSDLIWKISVENRFRAIFTRQIENIPLYVIFSAIGQILIFIQMAKVRMNAREQ